LQKLEYFNDGSLLTYSNFEQFNININISVYGLTIKGLNHLGNGIENPLKLEYVASYIRVQDHH
jgi:hypothetical protein